MYDVFLWTQIHQNLLLPGVNFREMTQLVEGSHRLRQIRREGESATEQKDQRSFCWLFETGHGFKVFHGQSQEELEEGYIRFQRGLGLG